MAAPGPMIPVLLASLNQRGWLRIMDNHEFGVQRKPCEISFVAIEKYLKIFRVSVIRSAMQRVVERFRHSVKVIAAGHHVPANVQLEFFRERQQAVENFRNASAHCSRVNHLYAAASQWFCEHAQLVNLAFTKQRRVVIQRNSTGDRYFAHPFLLSRSISRSTLVKARLTSCACSQNH